MAHLLKFSKHSDERGNLTVIQDEIDFEIKRIFYIDSVPENLIRGEHAHLKTKMVLICIKGSCEIVIKKNGSETYYILNSPQTGLFLDPSDWHSMHKFQPGTVLMAIASEKFDPNDYIYECDS